MEAAGWIRALAPLAVLALLAGSGVGRAPALGAAAQPWQPPPCRDEAAPETAGPGAAPVAWFRLAGVLDDGGSLSAQRLTLGIVGGRSHVMRLSPESFASGPVHGHVVVGDDDGSVSRLRVVDVGRGCVAAVAAESDVIRSAVLSPDGGTVVEHRVDRHTRADLGVWRRGADLGPAARLLPGLPPDDRFGPTFTTELRWTGGRLGVSSCGERACRNRVLDPLTGAVTTVDGTGPLIGAGGTAIVAFDACHGFPCPVLAVDTATGAREVLVPDAGPASLGGTGADVLVFAAGGTLASLDLGTRSRQAIADGDGLLPVHDGSLATSGFDVAAGDVAVAPDGVLADPGQARAVDPATSATRPAWETAP